MIWRAKHVRIRAFEPREASSQQGDEVRVEVIAHEMARLHKGLVLAQDGIDRSLPDCVAPDQKPQRLGRGQCQRREPCIPHIDGVASIPACQIGMLYCVVEVALQRLESQQLQLCVSTGACTSKLPRPGRTRYLRPSP